MSEGLISKQAVIDAANAVYGRLYNEGWHGFALAAVTEVINALKALELVSPPPAEKQAEIKQAVMQAMQDWSRELMTWEGLADRIVTALLALPERGTGQEPPAVIAALRRLYEVAFDAVGNPEDCDDCSSVDAAGDGDTCRLHNYGGTSLGTRLVEALEAAEDVLGPCQCGHIRTEHHDEYERPCQQCACRRFALVEGMHRSLPTERPSAEPPKFTAEEVEAWIHREARYENHRTLAMLRAYYDLLRALGSRPSDALQDPQRVYQAILRGEIGRPSDAQLAHLIGQDAVTWLHSGRPSGETPTQLRERIERELRERNVVPNIVSDWQRCVRGEGNTAHLLGTFHDGILDAVMAALSSVRGETPTADMIARIRQEFAAFIDAFDGSVEQESILRQVEVLLGWLRGETPAPQWQSRDEVPVSQQWIAEQWQKRVYPHIGPDVFDELLADTSEKGWDDVRKEVGAAVEVVRDALFMRAEPLPAPPARTKEGQ